MADNQQEPGKMFVGGLKWETTEESLRTYFSQFGELSSCTVMMDHQTRRPRGFGFVTFMNPEDTKKVLSQPDHILDSKKIDPKLATNNTKDKGKCKVFLGGVPPEATKEELGAVFSHFGAVDVIDHKTDGAGRGRGFAFLTFESEESAAKAVHEHFVTVRDKNVEVKVADPANRKGSGMGMGQRLHEYTGYTSNGQAFPDPQTQQSRGGYHYGQYGASGYYPQQYSYPPQAPYNGSSGAGYNMHTGAANGQAINYGEYGYPNSRDAGGFTAAQQQYAGYHQQGHYGANQAQGYGRSQPYNNYPVHQ